MERKPWLSAGQLTDLQESELHERAIEQLARELNLPVSEVQKPYHEALNSLKKDATIKAFLPVLVCRSVKERLRV